MRFKRRTLLQAVAALPIASTAARAENDAAWAALRSGNHLALMRHALAPGSYDPPGFRLADCSTQRNLSAEGRAQAVRIGGLFRSNGIASAAVFSSQWCRCLETGRLMALGEVKEQPLLNAYIGQRPAALYVEDPAQAAALCSWISQMDLARPPVLVTHDVVVSLLTKNRVSSGEIVVLRREPDGNLTVARRVSTD